MQPSYLYGRQEAAAIPSPAVLSGADTAGATRRELLVASVPVLVAWAAAVLARMLSAVAHLPGHKTATLTGMYISLLCFRVALDKLGSQNEGSSSLSISETESRKMSWWKWVCFVLSQKRATLPSCQHDRTNLVILLGATVVFVFSSASMLLEAGHSEWTQPSSSPFHSEVAVGEAVGDTTASEEETAVTPTASIELYMPIGLSIGVIMLHAAAAWRLVARRHRAVVSTLPPSLPFSYSASRREMTSREQLAAMDRGALTAVALSLLAVLFDVVGDLPRADVMFEALVTIVCCARAVRFVRPVVWMLAGGDATQLSREVSTLMQLLEKELQLLNGVVSVNKWFVDVLSCRDDGGEHAVPAMLVLFANVRCNRSMSSHAMHVTKMEASTRCSLLAQSSQMKICQCYVEVCPDTDAALVGVPHLRPHAAAPASHHHGASHEGCGFGATHHRHHDEGHQHGHGPTTACSGHHHHQLPNKIVLPSMGAAMALPPLTSSWDPRSHSHSESTKPHHDFAVLELHQA